MTPSRYIQREISWNAFNERVLDEALRSDLLPARRLKFIAITSANYDEFFMVRVGRLMRDSRAGDAPIPPGGQRPSAVLSQLLAEIRQVIHRQDTALTRDILPALAESGLTILPPEQWDSEARAKAKRIFEYELFPTCTPIAIDLPLAPANPAAAPNPIAQAAQRRIHAAFRLDNGRCAFVRLPENLERFRTLRSSPNSRTVILLDHILLTHGERLFPGRGLAGACLFRITRDADMTVDEERDEDFIAAMEEVLERRKSSFPVRLESSGHRPLAESIRDALELPPEHHFHFRSPLDLKAFLPLTLSPAFEENAGPLEVSQIPRDLGENDNIWDTLKDGDILLHHPYESFTPVIRMVESAAVDPDVLAVKMTLYRTSGDSPIVSALIAAAERGVQVTVIVELKARFDEGANIGWAARLEQAGAIVIYGLAGLKVHAKALMIVRREDSSIRRYLHLGTGNYNEDTAELYTDMGLITARDGFTRDAALFFNAVTGYSSEPHLETLTMAPFALRRETLRLIHRETERAKDGEEARITAKMNSLVDTEIIEALYEASGAGVRVNLNIRGICCLRPGVEGMSENIRVVSIIDTFLEHTRAFIYHNGGNIEVYLSSADWMTRNLDRRVELLFPIPQPAHKRRIAAALDAYFRDNTRARQLRPDGEWRLRSPLEGERKFRAQEHFAGRARQAARKRDGAERRALSVRRRPPGES